MKVDAGNGVNFFRMRIIPILAIALLAGACSRKTPAPAVVRPVKVATAAGAGLIDKDFAGMATPDDAVNLAFKVAGQVLDVPVSQGAGVKKGELLAELDPRDIELQVAATRSAFEETRSQQQRMQRLLEHEAVSRQEAEAAATRYAQARSTYENTLDLLKDTRLKAPFAGVVERKYVDNFERVQAGQPILRLVNPVTSTVQFTLPETTGKNDFSNMAADTDIVTHMKFVVIGIGETCVEAFLCHFICVSHFNTLLFRNWCKQKADSSEDKSAHCSQNYELCERDLPGLMVSIVQP